VKFKETALTFPSFGWLFLFFVIPTLMVFAFAFKPYDDFGGIEPGWTLNTLYEVLNPDFAVILWRTLWLSGITTAVCLAIGLPMAYVIARAHPRYKQSLLLLVVIPFWSSFLVRIFAWKALLHPEGFLKQALVALHIVQAETTLLYNAWAVLVVMIYTYLPFAILPIYSAAAKFNFQLLEAAYDLGASRWEAFVKVFMPGIQKGVFTALLMVFIPAIGAYVIPDVVGGTNGEMIGNKIAQFTFTERNLPLASSLSLFLAAIVLIPMSTIMILSGSGTSRLEATGVSKE